jgi:hypothetical protein
MRSSVLPARCIVHAGTRHGWSRIWIQCGDGAALLYVRAIGLRDLALASYIAGLTVGRHRRALAILLTLTTMIPAGDLFLLGTMGSGSAVHYLLHSVSLAGFAGLAWWVRNPTPPS